MAYKINLHITQNCNYRCKYCFAHFSKKVDLKVDAWKDILDNIKNSGLIDAINFAGGEPVLYHGFREILDYAHSLGFSLSIITNGSLLLNSKLMPREYFEKLDTLGISVDSVNPQTLIDLGACNKNHNVLTLDKLQLIINTALSVNPQLKIKFNTVVTNINVQENLNPVGELLSVNRWKLLRMKIFDNGHYSNAGLFADDIAFRDFTDRHARLSKDLVAENDLTRSYIMVDNQGNLLDDEGTNYHIVGNLCEEDFASVFARYQFNETTYAERYAG